jgi:hypothetical protein
MPQFEQGPIRPPSESGSLLIRFTRNCPWNKCTFCPVYKGQPFSRRSLGEIRQDIDAVHATIEGIKEISTRLGDDGKITPQVLNTIVTSPLYDPYQRQIAYWLYSGRGTVFIQDANSLMLPAEVLVEALEYLKAKVPAIQRVTSYARSTSLARKSLSDLIRIREAGLDRIHIGLESGSDHVLEFVKKGATAAEHIEAGRKVIEAGMELSEYVMPGLGGREWTREHAIETARVLNAIDPHFIRLRSLRIPDRAPLHEDVLLGRFTPLSDDETVQEIRIFIEHLEGIHSTLASDHIMNLLQEVEGTLPEDKPAMLNIIDRYLALPEQERQFFRFGSRAAAFRQLGDLNEGLRRHRVERALRALEAESGGDIESIITEMGDRYI